MSSVIERFLRYVAIDTQSNEESQTTPSTGKQLNLARLLEQELKELGLQDARIQEGYVYGTLPANSTKAIPAIGFIAHMDTSPDFSGTNVKAQLVENYDGQDILLNPEHNLVLSPADFP